MISRRRVVTVSVASLLILSVSSLILVSVVSSQSTTPIQPSSYGVVTLLESTTVNGQFKIQISSTGAGPCFLIRLLALLEAPADSDIVLDSIVLGSHNIIQLSGTSVGPKIVVVAAGSTVGDVVTNLPSFLKFLIVREPTGNDAVLVSSGIGFVLRFSSSTYTSGADVTVLALVTAPTTDTVTLALQ